MWGFAPWRDQDIRLIVRGGGVMMLRNISDRARVEGMRAFQNLLGGLRGQLARRPAGDLYLVRAPRSEHRAGETVWWSRDEPGATAGKSGASAPGGLSAGDVAVTKS